MRRKLAALLVVGLVAVAGCAGGSGPAADGNTTTGDPIYETSLDADTVTEAHIDALGDAGSYTIESEGTQTMAGQNQTVETSGEINGDMASDAVFSRTEGVQQTVELYAAGDGTAFRTFIAGDRTRYQNVSGQAGNATQYARTTVQSFVGLFDFSYEGTEDVDGETVHVYGAEGGAAVNTSSRAFGQLNESNIDAATATLRVRDDGVVTTAGYNLTVSFQGQTQSVNTTQRFTAIGDTDVAEPDWLSDAQSNTSA
ncbi:DUF7537 family lipoprotein [Halobacterium jilantaiense]|uniref:Lipoprotein n=1 Tax=Halobacterium jilantaiense TaxID=355548 RepID=A0A1I0QNY2_9EURY|nr:hypothetical protein [Halobacterium jilantaiense]SEW29134.1 hypothetical protein SAMN04487945_2801 [Halobacterium jilantaiense]